jgi:crossover junction endodeoxyribonuclease RuvC
MWAKGHRYIDVEPQHLKTWATGNGNAKKELVRADITARYGGRMHIGSTDEADAVAGMTLGLAAYRQPLLDRDGRELPVPVKNRAAIDKVDWPELDGVA